MAVGWIRSHAVSIEDLLRRALSPVNPFINWWSQVDQSTSTHQRNTDAPEGTGSSKAASEESNAWVLLQEMRLASQQNKAAFISIDVLRYTTLGDQITKVSISALAKEKSSKIKTRDFIAHTTTGSKLDGNKSESVLQSEISDALLSNESEVIGQANRLLQRYLSRYTLLYLLTDDSNIAIDISNSIEDPGKIRTVKAKGFGNVLGKDLGASGNTSVGHFDQGEALHLLEALESSLVKIGVI